MRRKPARIRTDAVPVLLAALMLLAACVRRPDGVQSDDHMLPVVTDMQLAEAYVRNRSYGSDNDTLRESLVVGVLKKHGMTREQYDTTMNWYARNFDAYLDLNKRVSEELSLRQREIAGKAGKESGMHQGLSPDLWPYPRMAMISSRSGSDVFRFSTPVSDVQPGMSVVWKMRLRSNASLRMLFGTEYSDGTVAYMTQESRMDRQQEMTLQTDSARHATRLFGYISVNDRSALPLWMDSIRLETRPFDPSTYYRISSQRGSARSVAAKPTESK